MELTLANGLLIVAASLLAGGLNSVAGGGSFFTFPALVLAGVPPISANATSTVALWPGSIASAVGYREELAHERRVLVVLGVASLVGGLLGALLLLTTPERTFERVIPWLLLGATALFAAGPWLTKRMTRTALAGMETRKALAGLAFVQLAIAVYGGYFGGGIGILMLASLSILGIENLHAANGLKNVLAAVINGVAVATFAVAGVVAWPFALLMVAGTVGGGYGGARLARRIEPAYVRGFVVVAGLALSAFFFVRIA